MANYRWRELFPSHIWQRGRNYYQDGHILSIRRYGNRITAKIEGTDIYTVSVALDAESNRIEDFPAITLTVKTGHLASIFPHCCAHWRMML